MADDDFCNSLASPNSPPHQHMKHHRGGSIHTVISIKDLLLMAEESAEDDVSGRTEANNATPAINSKSPAKSFLQSPESEENSSQKPTSRLHGYSKTTSGNDNPQKTKLTPLAEMTRSDSLVLKERRRLAIIMVGLPARGKTFTASKLARYLRWLGHDTRHYNVGKYRRTKLGCAQDSNFFRADNTEGLETRNELACSAFEDMLSWMQHEGGQVGVFDATNSTSQRRNTLLAMAEGHCKVIFVESICTDPSVIERNVREKIRASPDYADMPDHDAAMADFKARLANYEQVYEPVKEGSYIKLIDMVSGQGQMQVNNISGYLPGRIVFFLVNCHTTPRKIILTRHGESEYNEAERIGGDPKLSQEGEKYAVLLSKFIEQTLGQEQKASIWTSTLRRTVLTARHASRFPKVQWRALDEIHAGICDGMTYEEIRQEMPDEYKARKLDKLHYRYPRGESYLDVIQRLEPVIIELERQRSPVVVVAHQAVLRALYAYFMDKPLSEVPHIEVPLHTAIELSIGVGVKEVRHKLMESPL